MKPCCDNPTNLKCQESFERDPDTGYFEGSFYRCIECGSVTCEEDYAALCHFEDWKSRQIPEPEAVPFEIDRRTRIDRKEAA